MLEAAVYFAQRPSGFVHHGPGRASRFLELELDVEHASGGFVQPIDDASCGLVQQRHRDASGGFEQHTAEVIGK